MTHPHHTRLTTHTHHRQVASICSLRGIPLLVAHTYGLMGYVRLYLTEHTVVEATSPLFLFLFVLFRIYPTLCDRAYSCGGAATNPLFVSSFLCNMYIFRLYLTEQLLRRYETPYSPSTPILAPPHAYTPQPGLPHPPTLTDTTLNFDLRARTVVEASNPSSNPKPPPPILPLHLQAHPEHSFPDLRILKPFPALSEFAKTRYADLATLSPTPPPL